MKTIIVESRIIWNKKVKEWCGRPYYDKKNGCPNFNRLPDCPMNNRNIDEILKIEEPAYIVGVEFDLEEHRKRMKDAHPDWSFRQLNCVLYWQKSVEKVLKKEINNFLWKHLGMISVYKPEAYGVNLTRMLRNSGVPISWDYPLKKVYIVELIGRPK